MLVTKAKFLSYQAQFYNKIKNTPYKIDLEVVSVKEVPVSEEFSMDAFVGDSPRESKKYSLRCLYEKEVSDRTRNKYGLDTEVNGVIYLSPIQTKPIFGDYHIPMNRVLIHFEGEKQVISRVIYLEDFKEYGTCVGIQIFVKDATEGG